MSKGRAISPFARRAVVMIGIGTAVGMAGGCAAVLGFEDTTLRTDGEAGQSEGGPNAEGGPASDGGTSRLTTKPASLVVRRGSSVEVTIDIARGSDLTGTVIARLGDLPSGVTATNGTIDAPAVSATLKLSATAMATLGPKVSRLFADGTSLPAADVPLLVADAPGSLDVTWDIDGLAVDASRNLNAVFYAVAVQADQRIVAGGASGAPLAGWMLRRFTTTGALDAAFGTATAGLPVDGELRAIAFDAAGKIVCAGSSTPAVGQPPQVTLVRLSQTGAIDTTFGAPSGIVRLPIEAPGPTAALGVAVQPDGAVVVVGTRRDALGNNEAGIITRFKADGTRDMTFNSGATIVVPSARFVGVTLEGGAVVVAGSSSSMVAGAVASYVVVRRTAQGAVDPSFGTAGTASFGAAFRANGFAPLPGGLLAVVGDLQSGQASYTGGVVSSKGVTQFARAFAAIPASAFHGAAAQDDTRVVAVGHTAIVNGEARVGRFTAADGLPDPTFSDAGTAIIEQGGVANNYEVTLFAVAVEPNGRILAAGNRSNMGAAVYRLWP